MRLGWVRAATAAASVMFVVAFAHRASAEPLDVRLAVTVNGLTGQHQIGSGRFDTYSLLPLPLTELTVRSGADSLRVEALPPVTFGYTSQSRLVSTRLSIVNATVRHTFGDGWFAGAGQTVYNQTSQYRVPSTEVQSSRVTGLRLEAGREFGPAANRFEVFAAVNPVMHGVQYTMIPQARGCVVFSNTVSCIIDNVTFADPESAAQVDLTARLAHRLSSRFQLLAGLRYLNYTAHPDAAPGVLADRNVGFAPSVGIRARL